MKRFVKFMCLMLSMLLIVSLAIACNGEDENVDPITTKESTTPVVTTTAEDTTTADITSDTTTIDISTGTTTSDDGFGPLIPLVTDK